MRVKFSEGDQKSVLIPDVDDIENKLVGRHGNPFLARTKTWVETEERKPKVHTGEVFPYHCMWIG